MKPRRPKFSKRDKQAIAKLQKDHGVDRHEAARMFVRNGIPS